MIVVLPSDRFLLLASASPRREELLRHFGLEFHCLVATGVDESAVTGEASHVVKTLALAKAEWSRDRFFETDKERARGKSVWVIGSDTVVSRDGEVIGKPRDEADACRTLQGLSGRSHEVISGVAVLPPEGPARTAVEVSKVVFRELSDTEIRAYVASGDALGKAGAYGIQTGGRELVEGFRGCYFSIVGLPVRKTFEMLELPLPDCECAGHALQRGKRGCSLFP